MYLVSEINEYGRTLSGSLAYFNTIHACVNEYTSERKLTYVDV
jgi:hypothetical protein